MVEDQISIRGSSGYSRGAGTRVLVAIDGIPFYTGDTGEIIWEAVPVNQIQRIEVIKGSASSLRFNCNWGSYKYYNEGNSG
jgi:iron complex outermembrane receptor protein